MILKLHAKQAISVFHNGGKKYIACYKASNHGNWLKKNFTILMAVEGSVRRHLSSIVQSIIHYVFQYQSKFNLI